MICRRRLLGAAVLFAATGRARAAIRPPPPASRRLKLFNAHTGETFDGPYSTGDGLIPAAAAELSHFLRDFHSGVTVPMDMRVVDFLWDVLNAVGAGTATVLSAYRTPQTNAMLARTMFGVAEHSQHMYARAIDFTIGTTLSEALRAARSMRRGGVGWYPRSHFIHIDTGPVRNWDFGGEDLQRLLIHPEEELRSASSVAGRRPPHGRGAATGEGNATSQYAEAGTGSAPVRPSQYTAYGASEQAIRPSQYGSTP